MPKSQPTKQIFCANCQDLTPHTGEVDQNGEFVFTCTVKDCNRFVKLPADTDIAKFNEYAAAHQDANKGQITLEEQNKRLSALFADETEDDAADSKEK